MTEKTYTRFSITQRIEHWVLTISFAALVVTGLPQRYALAAWAGTIIRLLGGIEITRIIHRTAAIILALGGIYHTIVVAYKMYVLRAKLSMLPVIKDATDIFDTIRYNLGLIKEHPKLPRYTFAEKMEYWALIWGTLVMGATGFMLWNPTLAVRFLPGKLIPAAKAAHSAEALLATLAILVWHLYGVHIKTLNLSMFTGKLTRKQMLDEHAAELIEIESNVKPPTEASERTRLAKIKHRRDVFLPLAAVSTVVLGLGLYTLATVPDKVITIVPPVEIAHAQAQVFTPATATPTPVLAPHPTAVPTSPPPGQPDNVSFSIPHPLQEHEDCLLCHATDADSPFPADHADRPAITCLVCHTAEDQHSGLAQPVRHDIVERDDCVQCHALDLLPESHQPLPFTSTDCLLCHSKTAEEATDGVVSFANDIQPRLETYCAVCHSEAGLGGLDVTGYQSLATGGLSGPAFVAGSAGESLIVTTMNTEHPGVLTGDDLQKLVDWITAGAENN